MTRAHARLLGPCFKTGPESTQSYSVADRRARSPFEERRPRAPPERELIATPRLSRTVGQVGREPRVR
jgi:hypothetical protein